MLRRAYKTICQAIKNVCVPAGKYVRTGLPRGFHDPDTLLLHTSFSLLVDFVEIEVTSIVEDSLRLANLSGAESLSYMTKWAHECDVTQVDVWLEIQELYNWWTSVRPKRRDPLDDGCISEGTCKLADIDISSVISTDKYVEISSLGGSINKCDVELRRIIEQTESLYRAYETEDREMLLRLVTIRSFMWI